MNKDVIITYSMGMEVGMDNSNNYNDNQTNGGVLTSKERNSIIIAAILEVIGAFFYTIPCVIGAIILACQVKRKNTSKIIIIVIGVLEIGIVIVFSVVQFISFWLTFFSI